MTFFLLDIVIYLHFLIIEYKIKKKIQLKYILKNYLTRLKFKKKKKIVKITVRIIQRMNWLFPARQIAILIYQIIETKAKMMAKKNRLKARHKVTQQVTELLSSKIIHVYGRISFFLFSFFSFPFSLFFRIANGSMHFSQPLFRSLYVCDREREKGSG